MPIGQSKAMWQCTRPGGQLWKHCKGRHLMTKFWTNLPYILKGGARSARTPQTILNFPQKDCLRTRKVSKLHCLQSYWLSFPLFMFSHCNKLSIKVFKHIIFSTKLPHWHRILVIFRMYGWVPKEMQFWIYIWEELFRGQIFCQTKKGDHKKFWSKEN